MRVWFDAPAARDLLFLEGAVSRVARRHEALLTTSGDPTALALSRARRLGARRAGGPAATPAACFPSEDGKGGAPAGGRARLDAMASRLGPLARLASGFSPDLAVSVSSAEAARVAFGLAVPHVAFGMDEPGDDELARLTAPLVQKMIMPRRAPAAPLVRRGLAPTDIVRFRGTIASATSRRMPAPLDGDGGERQRQERAVSAAEGYVLARPPPHGGAAWAKEVAEAVLGGRRLAAVAVLPRPGQARGLRSSLGFAAKVIAGGVHDGLPLLGACRAFVGAAGSTMASEAAMCGVPAVAYGPCAGGARADVGESRLVRLRLLSRASTAAGLRARIGALLSMDSGARDRARARARAELSSMEEPFAALSRAARAAGARL